MEVDQADRRSRANDSHVTDKRKQALSLHLKSSKTLAAYKLVEACKATLCDATPAMSMYRILEFLGGENLAHTSEPANKNVACKHFSCDQ